MWPSLVLRNPWTYVWVFVCAVLFSWMLCHLVRRVSLCLGIVDVPNARKVHTSPVPLCGGVAIYIAFAATMVSLYHYSYAMIGIVLGGLPVMLVGALDDIRRDGVSAPIKFLTLVVVTLLLEYYGVRVKLLLALGDDYTNNPVLLRLFWLGDAVITLLWIVGVTSAMNAIDNMNGLASGVAGIACLAYAVVAFTTTPVPEYFMALMAIGLCGANVGFLFLNYRPQAKLFLGDSGSFFLGYALAAMGVLGDWADHAFVACVIPVLVLAVPIFDLTYVVIARYMTGTTRTWCEALSHCDKDHLSHRLVKLGLPPLVAVAGLWGLALALAVGGILLRNSTSVVNSLLLAVQALLVLGLVGVLLRRRRVGPTGNPPPVPAGQNVHHKGTIRNPCDSRVLHGTPTAEELVHFGLTGRDNP